MIRVETPQVEKDVARLEERVAFLEEFIRQLYNLHTCQGVTEDDHPCPICHAWSQS